MRRAVLLAALAAPGCGFFESTTEAVAGYYQVRIESEAVVRSDGTDFYVSVANESDRTLTVSGAGPDFEVPPGEKREVQLKRQAEVVVKNPGPGKAAATISWKVRDGQVRLERK
jgi:hypothetical protein